MLGNFDLLKCFYFATAISTFNTASSVFSGKLIRSSIFYLNNFLFYVIILSFWRVCYMIYPSKVFINQNSKEFY